MPKLDLTQIYLELEHEIKRLSQSTIVIYRDATREDAQQVISELKPDIDSWVTQLSQRTIACYELEGLLESKRDVIKLPRLKNKGVDKNELENFRNDILRLIAKSIMNSYLNSLFRSQTHTDNKNLKKENLF
ncbi:MAG: hypothetical protein WCG08_02600 [Paludibacter sp.]|jgi:N-dimethylarginine dimethylaminohydrolase